MHDIADKSVALVYILQRETINSRLLAQTLQLANIQVAIMDSPDMLLDSYSHANPACILLEFFLPDINGLQLMEILRQQDILAPVIFMSNQEDLQLISRAFNMGAYGYLKRPASQIELIEMVQQALNLNTLQLATFNRGRTYREKLQVLSKRELDIHHLLVKRHTARQIADILGISIRTVENKKLAIFNKLEISGHLELIRLTTELEMLDLFRAR